MTFRGIQADLGGFDPRLLGITVRFATHEEFERFRSPNYAFSAADLAKMKDDDAFRHLSEMTVLQHEIRHFHDFLLSPYGQTLFRLKLQAYFNGIQALTLLIDVGKRTSANCLPIPVTRWARMDEASRTSQAGRWSRGPKKAPDGGAWRPPPVPFLPDVTEPPLQPGMKVVPAGAGDLSALLRATLQAYDKIGELCNNPESAKVPMPLQPWHLMEVSALLVQAQEIAGIMGDALGHRFLNMLEESGFPTAAVRVLKVLEAAWTDRGLSPRPPDLAAVVAFGLMGSYATDGWKACPTHRIAALSSHLRAHGPPSPGEALRQTFSAWSVATGLSEPSEAMELQVRSNEALAGRYRESSASRGKGAKLTDTARVGAEALHRASSNMLAEFIRDPEGYVAPARYLENLRRYPQPSIRCEFDGFRLRVEPSDLDDWLVLFAQENLNGTQFMRTGLLNAGWSDQPVMPPEAASALYCDLLGVDYAFQPSNRLDWEFGEVARPEFRDQIGLTPLQITG